jgi:hypothetical protein
LGLVGVGGVAMKRALVVIVLGALAVFGACWALMMAVRS